MALPSWLIVLPQLCSYTITRKKKHVMTQEFIIIYILLHYYHCSKLEIILCINNEF
jgi:hypothetical protein